MSQFCWISTHTLRALAPAVGLVLALTACSPPSSQEEIDAADPTSSSAAPTSSASTVPKVLVSPTSEPPASAEPEVSLNDLCGPTCSVSGVAFIEHPTWGQIRVVTMLTERVLEDTGTIAAVDEDEVVL